MTKKEQIDQSQQYLNTQLERRTQELIALYQVGQKFITTLDLELIYQTIYDEIGQRLLGSPHLVVALVDEASDTIVCDFAIIDGERVEPTLFPPIPLNEGFTGEIIKNRQPRIVDLQQARAKINPQHQTHIGDEKIPMSGLYVPLIAGAKVVGTLNIQHYEADAFSETDLTLLAILANQAAAAIQNARLYGQVQTQAEQISQIMNSVPDGVLLLDEQQRVLVANPVARTLLALLAGVTVGQRLTQLGDYPLNELLAAVSLGQWQRFDHDSGKNKRVFEVIARPLAAAPAPVGWVLVLRDVTESRLIQQQLQKQERLAAIGQLAAGIAHDFNNLMSVVLLYTQMISGSAHLTDHDRKQLSIIGQQAKHAARIIQQILDFSRRSVLERQPLDMWSVLEGQVDLLRHALPEHIEIVVEGKPGQYLVQADPTRIQQIVVNLALNARDAMPQGGQLFFYLEQIQIGHHEKWPVPNIAAGDWVRLTVRDTGVGITPENLEHIFEPFFTTKTPGEGTGLGMAQVHGIVAQHQGHVIVESELGQGTAVVVYLPALTLPAVPWSDSEETIESTGQGELILVVEDNDILRTSLVDYLQMWHYQVLEAANGEEALTLLAHHGQSVVLVLSDIVMPRMGGIELFQALKEQGYTMPVIFLTGHPLADKDLGLLRELGLYAWLSKPPDMNRLAQLISQALAA
jgi:two-component system, cell cycle sensor histidine kinase and response regulator CckA